MIFAGDLIRSAVVNLADAISCRCPGVDKRGPYQIPATMGTAASGVLVLDTTRIVRDGALLSLVGSACLLVLLRFNLRIFLRHFAKEIQELVPPKSEKEQRMSILLGLLIGAPFAAALLWRTATLESHSFWELFAYAYGVLFIFNLVDLLILDWLIVCWLKPRWVILPGTEQIVIPNPYLHHFKEFLMGTVGLAIAGLAIAALVSLHS